MREREQEKRNLFFLLNELRRTSGRESLADTINQ